MDQNCHLTDKDREKGQRCRSFQCQGCKDFFAKPKSYSEKCSCIYNIVEYIEKEFAPTVVFELKGFCPKCGISFHSKKNTPEGVGFKKYVDQAIKALRKEKADASNKN